MKDVESLVERALASAPPQRLAAIAELNDLAHDGHSRREAVSAMIRLWQEGFVALADLALYTPTVLELWHLVFEEIKPFQQEVVKVEWVTDEDYAPVSGQAERLLALMGYLPGEEFGGALGEGLQKLTDPSLKMVAIMALLRRNGLVSAEEIEPLAASHLVRVTLWEKLQDLGAESLMPAKWTSPEALAASELARWLSHPNELNAFPEEVELMNIFSMLHEDAVEVNVYLFRFREFPMPWEPGEGWMAGVVGPYRNQELLGSPWSVFRRWDSMSPEEHFDALYSR